jgi:hypothetical protein
MAAVFFRDLEPRRERVPVSPLSIHIGLQQIKKKTMAYPLFILVLAQVRSRRGEVEAVVGCSSLPEDAAADAPTVVVGDSNITESGNTVVGRELHGGRCRGIAG